MGRCRDQPRLSLEPLQSDVLMGDVQKDGTPVGSGQRKTVDFVQVLFYFTLIEQRRCHTLLTSNCYSSCAAAVFSINQ